MTTTADLQQATFKQGSTTYFNSSIFFPPQVRRDVTTLYAFVRVADNYVDAIPQQRTEFAAFRARYEQARSGLPSGDPIVDEFVALADRRGFAPDWTDAFLHSMELDLTKGEYQRIDETLEYIYGSAEVIGLYMARLLDLPEASFQAARMLGRAMQYINFIRDIDEDNRLGRRYLPLGDSGLTSLDPRVAREHPDQFRGFLTGEIDRFQGWQAEAEAGFRYIPKRYLIAIKTASDMYKWTAAQIAADPFVVFERKVKPRKARIVMQALLNAVRRPPKGEA